MKTYELTINRTIPASPEEVYDAWLDPALPSNPWHGSRKLEWQPREGNLWYFLHMSKSEEPRDRPHFGRFATLQRGRKIVLDWMSYNTCGLESVVTVTLEPQGDETLLTLKHANIPDNDLGRAHEGGWAHFTGLLEAKFAKSNA
jgi:uncharacterized protein YndB with AHSA1/START domain